MTDMVLAGNFTAVAQGIVPPIADAAFYLRLGDTEAKTLRNLMPGGSSFTKIGTLVVQPTYSTEDGTNGHINTGILETATSGTIFAIARAPAATGTVYIQAAQAAATSLGFGLEMTTAAIQATATFTANGTNRQSAVLAIPDRNTFRLYVGEAEQNVGLRVADETRGLNASLAKVDTRTLNIATTFRIGARANTSTGGSIDIHQIMYVPRILTSTERARVLAFMRAYAAAQGITV